MKLTTLACLAALGLIGPATLALAAPPAAPGSQAQPSLGRAGQQPATRGSDKRRRSYAACNRASHARGLRGGKRRRFLIRCKLGYERPRSSSTVQPAALPQAPGPSQAPNPATPPAERRP